MQAHSQLIPVCGIGWTQLMSAEKSADCRLACFRLQVVTTSGVFEHALATCLLQRVALQIEELVIG
jgi:hypothetical protein